MKILWNEPLNGERVSNSKLLGISCKNYSENENRTVDSISP